MLIVAFSNCGTSAEELPSAESLFAKHVQVSYGKDGRKKHNSMTVEFSSEIKQYGLTVSGKRFFKAPGLFYTESEAFGMTTRAGCNQTSCWELGLQGEEQIIAGKELKRWLQDYDYYHWKNIAKYSKSMQTIELSQWNKEDAYKVRLVDYFDQENFYYFSKKSGFMIGSELMVADLGGFNARSSTYSEFTQFGPFTLPKLTVQEQASVTRLTTVNSLSVEEISDAFFEFPQNVKQLMER